MAEEGVLELKIIADLSQATAAFNQLKTLVTDTVGQNVASLDKFATASTNDLIKVASEMKNVEATAKSMSGAIQVVPPTSSAGVETGTSINVGTSAGTSSSPIDVSELSASVAQVNTVVEQIVASLERIVPAAAAAGAGIASTGNSVVQMAGNAAQAEGVVEDTTGKITEVAGQASEALDTVTKGTEINTKAAVDGGQKQVTANEAVTTSQQELTGVIESSSGIISAAYAQSQAANQRLAASQAAAAIALQSIRTATNPTEAQFEEYKATLNKVTVASKQAEEASENLTKALGGAKDAAAAAAAGHTNLNKEMMEARHAELELGQIFGIRVPRIIATFLSHIQGIAPIMAAAFAPVAVIGLVEVIGHAITKLKEWIKEAETYRMAWVDIDYDVQRTTSNTLSAIDKQEERIVALVKGPVAAARYGFEHMRDDADKSLAETAKNFEAAHAQITKERNWIVRVFTVLDDSSEELAKKIDNRIKEATELSQRRVEIILSLGPNADLRAVSTALGGDGLKEYNNDLQTFKDKWDDFAKKRGLSAKEAILSNAEERDGIARIVPLATAENARLAEKVRTTQAARAAFALMNKAQAELDEIPNKTFVSVVGVGTADEQRNTEIARAKSLLAGKKDIYAERLRDEKIANDAFEQAGRQTNEAIKTLYADRKTDDKKGLDEQLKNRVASALQLHTANNDIIKQEEESFHARVILEKLSGEQVLAQENIFANRRKQNDLDLIATKKEIAKQKPEEERKPELAALAAEETDKLVNAKTAESARKHKLDEQIQADHIALQKQTAAEDDKLAITQIDDELKIAKATLSLHKENFNALATLDKTAADRKLTEQITNADRMLAIDLANEPDLEKKKAIQQKYWNTLTEFAQAHSTEIALIDVETEAKKREHAQRELAEEKNRLGQLASDTRSFEDEINNARLARGEISTREHDARQLELLRAFYAVKMQLANADIALLEKNNQQETTQYKTALDARNALARKEALEEQKIADDLLKKYTEVYNQITGVITSNVNSWMQGQERFARMMQKIWEDLAMMVIQKLEKMLVEFIKSEVVKIPIIQSFLRQREAVDVTELVHRKGIIQLGHADEIAADLKSVGSYGAAEASKTAATIFGESARTAAKGAFALTQGAIDTAAMAKKALNDSTTIAGNVAVATSSTSAGAANALETVPFPANIAASASVLAVGAGLIAGAAFEEGGIASNTGLAFVHGGEGILPPETTDMLVSAGEAFHSIGSDVGLPAFMKQIGNAGGATANAGGTSGPTVQQHNYNLGGINAVDAPSFMTYMKQNKAEIQKMIKESFRGGTRI
jgi:hypothetical protein